MRRKSGSQCFGQEVVVDACHLKYNIQENTGLIRVSSPSLNKERNQKHNITTHRKGVIACVIYVVRKIPRQAPLSGNLTQHVGRNTSTRLHNVLYSHAQCCNTSPRCARRTVLVISSWLDFGNVFAQISAGYWPDRKEQPVCSFAEFLSLSYLALLKDDLLRFVAKLLVLSSGYCAGVVTPKCTPEMVPRLVKAF